MSGGTTGRPKVWTPSPKRQVFMDCKTGRLVTWDWRRETVTPSGRRKTPALVDMLNAAHALDAEQIILTGKLPEYREDREHWMLADTPGWEHGKHWLAREPRIGRYKNTLTGRPMEVRPAAEWFNDAPVDPMQARTAWEVLAAEVEKITGTDQNGKPIAGSMFITPAATAVNLWGMLLPKTMRNVPTLPADIAEELHKTSGQHRIEHLTTTGEGDNENEFEVRHFDAAAQPKLDTFSYVDGRFMYSALGWGLALGARRIGRDDAAMNLFDPDGKRQYTRARYKVRVTIPHDWHHVGLLALQAPDVADGWLYPNRPGVTFETWADGAEVMIAQRHGWAIDPLEGIEFGTTGLDGKKPNVLNAWADKLGAARESVQARDDLDPVVRLAVAGALRSMLLQGIGNFAKRLRGADVVVKSPREIPAEYAADARRFGSAWVYSEPGREFSERERGYYHPELAVQVWGRARARMLESPAPTGYTGPRPGMLSMDPATILGVRGDAVYSSVVPPWALPLNRGGADDGKNGRLRVKGVLRNVPTPLDESARNELRVKAEQKGGEF